MDIFEAIKTRRSRRLFTTKDVADELVEKIIHAGLHAPSSRNCQPWNFIVVRDKAIQQRLGEMKTEKNQQHILTAPLTIVLCVDKNKSPKSFVEDGVTAAGNMLLATHALGLGSVYISAGSKDDPVTEEEVRGLLGLPGHIKPLALLPVGYPDKKEEIEDKELVDAESIIFRDKWRS